MRVYRQQIIIFVAAFLGTFFILSTPEVFIKLKTRSILNEKPQNVLNGAEKSLLLAKSWLFSNMRDEGLFVYAYNPESNVDIGPNNEVRQLLASRILAAECAKTADAFLCDAHKKNLNYVLSNWYKEGPHGGYILYTDQSSLGGIAMFLRTLIASPYFEEHKKRASNLARTIQYLQNPDGSYRAWYTTSLPENEEYALTFYSGEAILALAEYYEKTRDPAILSAALASQKYYIQKYAVEIEENFYPAYVTWQTQALTKLYKIRPDQTLADAIFVINDRLLQMQDRTVHLGRFYNPKTPQYGNANFSTDAADTEGLAFALEASKIAGAVNQRRKYCEAIKLSLYNFKQLQYDRELSRFQGKSYRYIGAFKNNTESAEIRLDNVVHAIDALEQIVRLGPEYLIC